MNQGYPNSGLFYLCCGFHRSGTSLLAQSLAKSGLHMGDELMGASFSNPLGHVEDMPIVRLHDKIFAANGQDWRFHDNTQLIKPDWLANNLEKYIAEKLEVHSSAGVKDPRAVFFLEDWLKAGKDNIRYILVYRHWSTAVNSIFNRASRHLINGTHPISANKLNFHFFAAPELAFTMWYATNKRLVDFYRSCPDKCLLISQDAFVSDNQRARTLTGKIALPDDALNNEDYQSNLMTDTVPSSIVNLVLSRQREKLDALWNVLEHESDLPAAKTPRIVEDKVLWPPLERCTAESGQSADLKTPPEQLEINSASTFDFSELSWEEALGVMVKMPESAVTSDHYQALMNRTFTGVFNYESLARIAHGNGHFLVTKLAKMRAMHCDAASWKIDDWSLYSSDDEQWNEKSDALLPSGNPFSLRPASEREANQPDNTVDVSSTPWGQMQEKLSSGAADDLEQWLTSTLLYRSFPGPGQYEAVAEIARNHQFFLIEEFALLKALRLDNRVTLMVQLGDFYRRLHLHKEALSCFVNADSLEPERPPVLARMADCHIQSDDLAVAEKLLVQAEQSAPRNRVVQVCRKRLNEKQSPVKSAKRSNELRALDTFVMPVVRNYQDVVELIAEDPGKGKRLDSHNQSMSFILRENEEWLNNGKALLADAPAFALEKAINKQWAKVFSPLTLYASLEHPDAFTLARLCEVTPQWRQVKDNDASLAISVQVSDLACFAQLVGFIEQLPFKADIHIHCGDEYKAFIQDWFNEYPNGKVALLPVTSTFELFDQASYAQYDAVCMIRAESDGTATRPKSEYLQQVYGVLGNPAQLKACVTAMIEDKQLGMVFPGYHPDFPHRFITEEALAISANILEELGDRQSPIEFTYPQSQMCWLKPTVFAGNEAAFNALSERWGLCRALSMWHTKHGYTFASMQRFLSY